MKNVFFISLIALLGIMYTACSNAPKGEKAVVNAAKEVKKAVAASSFAVAPGSLVSWTGSKIAGKHMGTFAVSNGNVKVNNGKVVGGKFTIDMNSMVVTDLKAGEGKEDLEGHLKSADFFNVAANPTSTFEITNVANGSVTGNLTMMGVTKSITFPANIMVTDQGVKVESSDFTINRTDFGMKYGSASFFDGLKDKAINDEVSLKVSLSAK